MRGWGYKYRGKSLFKWLEKWHFSLSLSICLARCLHSVLSRDESLWPLPLLRAATPPPSPPDGQQCRRVMNVHAEWPPVETLCMQKLFCGRCDWKWLFCGHCDSKWLFCYRWGVCCKMDDCSVALRILRTDGLSCHLHDDGKWEVLSLGFADLSFVFYSYHKKQIHRQSGKLRCGFKILRLAQKEGSSRIVSSGMWRCDVKNLSRNHTASHFRRLESSAAVLWERRLLQVLRGSSSVHRDLVI